MIVWALALSASAEPCFEVVDGRIPAGEAGLVFAGTELLPEADTALAGVACRLHQEPALSMQIAVHTDARGSEAFNLKVSQARADAVAAALQGRGIDAGRLHPVGFGETRPIHDNMTEAGRAANRRIELGVDPDRWTSGPEIAAPAPAPAPAPAAPAPAAPASPCPAFREVWTGCAQGGACETREPPARAADLAARCLGAKEGILRDGDVWYVRLEAGVLEVRAGGAGSVLRLTGAR